MADFSLETLAARAMFDLAVGLRRSSLLRRGWAFRNKIAVFSV